MTPSETLDARPIRLLVVEDQMYFRDGLVEDISQPRFSSEVNVVGDTGDAETGLELAQKHNPDVVLVDLRLPKNKRSRSDVHEEHGLWLIQETRSWAEERRLNVHILVLTATDDQPILLYRALKAGADGYLIKNEDLSGRLLLNNIQDVLRGNFRPGPAVAEQMRDLDDLAPREREVLEQIAAGKSNKEIAATLGIAEKTVKFYVSNIISKLHLIDRTGIRKRDG